jgi:Cu(I)/Ag(I) efflux system membrane fusion protein
MTMEPILEGTPDPPRGRGRALVAAMLAVLVLGSGAFWLWRPSPGSAPSGADSNAAPTAPKPDIPPARVRIAPERQQQIGVRFSEAMNKPAKIEIRAVGRVAYDETQIAHVHTKVNGWIEDVFVDFVGAPVRRGQPLFTIYSPELVASQEEYLLARRARDELGGSSFARVSEGSRTLLDSARRRLELWDMTPGQIEDLEKKGTVSRTLVVFSPVSGVVTERMAYHHGRTVTPEMDLYTIVDLSRVWVQAEVYEYEAPHIRVGQAAEIALPYDARKKSLRGKVAFIAPFLDPKTRTVQVRMEFPNPDLRLRPESFVNVTLQRDLGERCLVPKDAVMDAGQAQYVFVDQGDGYLEPREVKAGPEVAEGRIIDEGLKEGERVATAANFIIDSESRLKGAFDAMGRPTPVEASGGPAPQITAEVATNPSPARIGKNQVRVRVKDAQGQPINDADVDIRFFMPQMTGMAEVNLTAKLEPAGKGEYTGEIKLPIAWSFATTVTVRKGGQVVGIAESTVTAR